ncbi:MAG: pimeloyl-ACP methyl ester carboxylesterase [Oceanicoccus sp.]|jgi:pimeloyl-ACP methyl ester carboxylesterase
MKIFKYGAVSLMVVVAATLVFLFKGDLSKDYVDGKYSNELSQFLLMTNGARVHYRDEGNKAGSVIVLVHGSNASLHTWQDWVAILGDQYRLISMDLPGHGLTGATPDADYSSQAHIETVNAVVSHLNISSFVLGGNSMGGGVTWRYTLQYPEQIKAMILVDSSGLPQFSRTEGGEVGDAGKDSGVERGDVEKKDGPIIFSLMRNAWFRNIAQYLDPYWLTRQGVLSAYNNSPVVTEELIDRYYELALREGSRVATLSRFASYDRTNNKTVDPSLLALPTLLMWGREDALIPVSVAHQFSDVLANDTLVIYDGVGHAPMEEVPAQSAEDVVAFLKELNN